MGEVDFDPLPIELENMEDVLVLPLSPSPAVIEVEQLAAEDLVALEVLPDASGVTLPSEIVVSKKRTRKDIYPRQQVRKRKQQPHKWKTTQAKRAAQSGQAHKSLRGLQRRSRSVGEGCPATCRRKCHSKITLEKRKIINQQFWAINDHSRQWDFLMRYIKTVPPKQRKIPLHEADKPRRNRTLQYSLYDPDTQKEIKDICKKMFFDTFDVSSSRVKTPLNKMTTGKGKISPDKRGKFKKVKATTLAMKESVRAHIKRFPVMPSHYCRARSKRKYLAENLKVSIMHRQYIAERAPNAPNTASYKQYLDIFNSEFNYSFHRSKKDRCTLCLQYEAGGENARKLEEQYRLHIRTRDLLWDWRRAEILKSRPTQEAVAAEDEPEDDLVAELSAGVEHTQEQEPIPPPNLPPDGVKYHVASFDLQKILNCPKSSKSAFYYKRKLSCYNFTVFDSTTMQGYCYVWDQTIAKKGSNEVNSSLYHYAEMMSQEGVLILIVYSDNCTGQNKNMYLFCLYYLLAQKFKLTIIHRWLEKGHTEMGADSVHARIEIRTQKIDIFSPAEWYGNIRAAKVNRPRYKVIELNQSMVYDFKKLADFFDWSKIPTSSLKEFSVDPQRAGYVTFRTKLPGEAKEVYVLRKKPGRPVVFSSLQLKPALTRKIPLPKNLLQDLQWYVKKDLIPESAIPFYESLPNWFGTENDNQENMSEHEEEEDCDDCDECEDSDENQNEADHDTAVETDDDEDEHDEDEEDGAEELGDQDEEDDYQSEDDNSFDLPSILGDP